jgi:hypothetical protein
MKRIVGDETFFTHLEYAQKCVDLLALHFDLAEFDNIIEPSAGTGVFVELLKNFRLEAIDIRPRHESVAKADFFLWSPSGRGRTLVIGNPPFGQRASLAVKFLERAMHFSDVVAFVLPRSFQKYTFQNRVDSSFHLVDSLLGDQFVGEDGTPIRVKTVFQIWERRNYQRSKVVAVESHEHFSMRHAHLSRISASQLEALRDGFSFAIPQAGSNFFPKGSREITRGSWWFISPHQEGVREIFEQLDFSFIDNMNTFHKSLSKADIITAYSNALVRNELM